MTKGSRCEKAALDERTCVVNGRSLKDQDHHEHGVAAPSSDEVSTVTGQLVADVVLDIWYHRIQCALRYQIIWRRGKERRIAERRVGNATRKHALYLVGLNSLFSS